MEQGHRYCNIGRLGMDRLSPELVARLDDANNRPAVVVSVVSSDYPTLAVHSSDPGGTSRDALRTAINLGVSGLEEACFPTMDRLHDRSVRRTSLAMAIRPA